MPGWPKEKLLEHGPELPMAERIRRYQENIKVIRKSGCTVPAPSMVDSLDPTEIELWFADSAFILYRLNNLIVDLSDKLPTDPEP